MITPFDASSFVDDLEALSYWRLTNIESGDVLVNDGQGIKIGETLKNTLAACVLNCVDECLSPFDEGVFGKGNRQSVSQVNLTRISFKSF